MASFLIALFGRATQDSSDLTVETAATAYFFEAGTTTPLTVYTLQDLATPRGTSVAADSEGIFPQCWTDRALVKVDVRDSTGASLPGFPQDNFPGFAVGGQDAADIGFTPVTGNAATDTQAGIANNTARLNRLDNGAAIATSGGSGGAYTLTSQYTISAYAALQEFEFVANHASVGSAGDTLNVDGVGAVVIKKYSGSTTKTDLSAGDISTGDIVRVKHDGTHFVLCGTSSGGMEFIESQDASGAAPMDFTGFNSALYDAYVFEVSNLIVSGAGGGAVLQTSSDGGSTFDSGATDYEWSQVYLPMAGSPTPTYGGSAGTTGMSFGPGQEGAADGDTYGVSGTIRVHGPHLAAPTFLSWQGANNANGVTARWSFTGSGVRDSAADVDALRFSEGGGGNFSSGTITMYGLRNS